VSSSLSLLALREFSSDLFRYRETKKDGSNERKDVLLQLRTFRFNLKGEGKHNTSDITESESCFASPPGAPRGLISKRAGIPYEAKTWTSYHSQLTHHFVSFFLLIRESANMVGDLHYLRGRPSVLTILLSTQMGSPKHS